MDAKPLHDKKISELLEAYITKARNACREDSWRFEQGAKEFYNEERKQAIAVVKEITRIQELPNEKYWEEANAFWGLDISDPSESLPTLKDFLIKSFEIKPSELKEKLPKPNIVNGISINGHPDGDYSYLCDNEYCRCMQ